MSFEQDNAAMLGKMDDLLSAIKNRTQDAYKIYVASTGDDGDNGTLGSPVQTFCEAVRRLKEGTFNIIYLKSGESFDTITGQRSHTVVLEGSTTIVIDVFGASDLNDPAQRATLTLSTQVIGGLNASAMEIHHVGDLYFGSRYVNFICAAPAAAIGLNEPICALMRNGHSMQGGVISLHIEAAAITTVTEGVFFVSQLYATQLSMSLRLVDLSGPQALIRQAAASCAMVTCKFVTAAGGAKVLDGGVVGQNVLTNVPSITV